MIESPFKIKKYEDLHNRNTQSSLRKKKDYVYNSYESESCTFKP